MSEERRNEGMDLSLLVMAVMLAIVGLIAFLKIGRLPWEGLALGGKLLWEVLPRLLLGFAMAGLLPLIIPQAHISRWLGADSGLKGIGIGWAIGTFLPGGGPYVSFPIILSLMKSGAAVGPMITFMAAKSLLGPVRLLTWELPMLGGQFVISRLVATFFVPPLMGIMGQFVFRGLFKG